ncbi:MAG: MBL fold metallo-hydrolase [Candidatus Kerfeldbacteria bacterium]|nr:MBL fold metallo-hydrolase [Candidatus Kerfeldbacteria bacterium]
MEREGYAPVETRDIPNAEQVFSGGWRLTKGITYLDVPESWAIYDGEGFLLIDPGGELPVETVEDARSVKPLAAAATLSWRSDKIEALRELEQIYDAPVKAVLLTHGDADHTNNVENVTGPEVPIYVDRREWWSTLSPEKQFAAGAKNFSKSALTGNDPGRLRQRDEGFQTFARSMNNPRGGEQAHARKQALAERFRDYPEMFPIAAGQLDVVAVPGHAPGEHGFYVPEEKLFIGGDLITTSKKGQADRLNIFLPEANIYDAIGSLKHLQSMDIEKYYPAHGPPILGREEFQAHVRTLLDDAEQLVDRILERAEKYQEENVHDLVGRVFVQHFDRPGMSEQSKKSWIMSVLRDQPTETSPDVATL